MCNDRLRRVLRLAVLLLLLTPTLVAQEAVNLTAPIARPSISAYTPGALYLDVFPAPRITVVLYAGAGTAHEVREVFTYPCALPCTFDTPAEVATLIGQLNTANLSTRSLWRRVFDRLVADFPTRFPGGATVP